MLPFEFFIALRHLKAKRKQAFISVITTFSIIGCSFLNVLGSL